MFMSLEWEEEVISISAAVVAGSSETIACIGRCNDSDAALIRRAICETVEKAVELIALNVNDHSRYLIFEWDIEQSLLTVVVSDDNKVLDAPRIVQCYCPSLEQSEPEDCAATVKYWIRDYLTTCDGFMHYSLIAVFHSSTRGNTELL
jgi:hypothetical protein